MENEALILNEPVRNGGTYELLNFGGIFPILVDTKIITIQAPPKSSPWHKECPTNYCSQGLMQAQCSPDLQCGSGRMIPSFWFDLVTQSYATDFEQHPRLMTNYYHDKNFNLACLPCCHLSSNHPKIPSEIETKAHIIFNNLKFSLFRYLTSR